MRISMSNWDFASFGSYTGVGVRMHFQSPSMASIVTQSQLPARIPRKQAICTQLEDVQQRDFRATKWMGTLQKVERNKNGFHSPSHSWASLRIKHVKWGERINKGQQHQSKVQEWPKEQRLVRIKVWISYQVMRTEQHHKDINHSQHAF